MTSANPLLQLLCAALSIYWFILLARIVLSWLRLSPFGAGGKIVEVIYALTDPVLRPVQNLIPPVRVGMAGIDLSPIIIFVILGVLQRAVCS